MHSTELSSLMKDPNKLSDKQIKEITKALEELFPSRGINWDRLYAQLGHGEFAIGLGLFPLTLHKLFFTNLLEHAGANWEEITLLVAELALLILVLGLGTAEGYHWCFPGEKPKPIRADSELPGAAIIKLNSLLIKLRNDDPEAGYPKENEIQTYQQFSELCEQLMYNKDKAKINIPHLETYKSRANSIN